MPEFSHCKLRILIIGGSGYIGRNLYQMFSRQLMTCFVVGRKRYDQLNHLLTPFDVNAYFSLAELSMQQILLCTQAEYVIDLSGGWTQSLDPIDEFNLISESFSFASQLYKEIDNCSWSINYIYFSSGGAVYGENKSKSPFLETSSLNPISTYGRLKCSIEDLICSKAGISNGKIVIVRPSNAYGGLQPSDRGQGFIANAWQRMKDHQSLVLYGNGDCIRDWIHISDICEAIFVIIHALLNHHISSDLTIYNIGTGLGYSLTEVVLLMRLIRPDLSLDICYEDCKSDHLDYNVLDVSSLALLGWKPLVSLESGLEMTLGK